MIKNITKEKILVKNLETADSIGKKTKGLMFRKNLARDSGLIMVFRHERKHEIWMLGMRFPIDIVFIDKDKRVVDIKHSVKPIGKNPKTWAAPRPNVTPAIPRPVAMAAIASIVFAGANTLS